MSDAQAVGRLQRRCPRLGGPVKFDYCAGAGEADQPCFKVFDCWYEKFDVVRYFKTRLPPAAFSRLQASRPPDKVTSLVEMIRQAQRRQAEN